MNHYRDPLADDNNENPNTPTLSQKKWYTKIDLPNQHECNLYVCSPKNETVAEIIHHTNKYVQMNK